MQCKGEFIQRCSFDWSNQSWNCGLVCSWNIFPDIIFLDFFQKRLTLIFFLAAARRWFYSHGLMVWAPSSYMYILVVKPVKKRGLFEIPSNYKNYIYMIVDTCRYSSIPVTFRLSLVLRRLSPITNRLLSPIAHCLLSPITLRLAPVTLRLAPTTHNLAIYFVKWRGSISWISFVETELRPKNWWNWLDFSQKVIVGIALNQPHPFLIEGGGCGYHKCLNLESWW